MASVVVDSVKRFIQSSGTIELEINSVDEQTNLDFINLETFLRFGSIELHIEQRISLEIIWMSSFMTPIKANKCEGYLSE